MGNALIIPLLIIATSVDTITSRYMITEKRETVDPSDHKVNDDNIE